MAKGDLHDGNTFFSRSERFVFVNIYNLNQVVFNDLNYNLKVNICIETN